MTEIEFLLEPQPILLVEGDTLFEHLFVFRDIVFGQFYIFEGYVSVDEVYPFLNELFPFGDQSSVIIEELSDPR